MAGDINNYLGGARHAPQAQVSGPDLFGDDTRPVWSQSRPALDSDVQGTGDMLSGVHKGSNKGPRGMGSPNAVSSPLDVDSHAAIIRASGLGRRAPERKGLGEQMSDADGPTQTVKALSDGSFVHARQNPATGNVNSMPIGSGASLDGYEHLNYDSAPANVGELQQRLGLPDFFGQG